MKNITTIAALVLLALTPLAIAQGTGGQGLSPQAQLWNDAFFGPLKIKPGNSDCNGDICVDNDANSNGDAKITPKVAPNGDATKSTVTTESGFKGDVTSVESGDTVNLGNNNVSSVSCSGGTVNVGNGSTTTITNAGGSNTNSVNVVFTSGASATIGPGSTITFST